SKGLISLVVARLIGPLPTELRHYSAVAFVAFDPSSGYDQADARPFAARDPCLPHLGRQCFCPRAGPRDPGAAGRLCGPFLLSRPGAAVLGFQSARDAGLFRSSPHNQGTDLLAA